MRTIPKIALAALVAVLATTSGASADPLVRPSGSLSSQRAASLHSPSCRSAPGR